MERESAWVVQSKAGMHVVQEAALEGVEVLGQVCIEEGQLPRIIVQQNTDPLGMNRNPDFGGPAIVQELILVPKNRMRTVLRAASCGDPLLLAVCTVLTDCLTQKSVDCWFAEHWVTIGTALSLYRSSR